MTRGYIRKKYIEQTGKSLDDHVGKFELLKLIDYMEWLEDNYIKTEDFFRQCRERFSATA
jgi:hypothetical protein